MGTIMSEDVSLIAGQFQIEGQLSAVQAFGSGHINDTFSVICEHDGDTRRYVLQRINHEIFKNPPKLMENVVRVTEHIRKKVEVENSAEVSRQLNVIKTQGGFGCYKDLDGQYWRMYNMIEDAMTYDTIESAALAFEAARMFGWFQRILTDLPGEPLYDTIPDFHNTPKRFRDFQNVLDKNPFNRAKDVKAEIDFVLDNAWICDVLLDLVKGGQIPIRITHNDTKINNVMLDEKTGRGVCVIDLDTVMPGLSLYDMGDMIRTATCPAAEDEKDLSKIHMDINLFEQLARGFSHETGRFLTDAEKKNLAFSGMLITFEQFIRFLGDYLAGDVYYKIHREGHNLDRARTQMKLVESIMEQREQMEQLVQEIWRDLS
jgi:thiamine kinase-like enzyme